MAAVRLSRLQTRRLRWLAADAQRTRRRMTRSHPERVAALPSAKGNISHSLHRLEMQGLSVMTRTAGGKTASVSLTAAGRQKAIKITGSDEAILRTFFERKGLANEATNWLNVVIASHSPFNW